MSCWIPDDNQVYQCLSSSERCLQKSNNTGSQKQQSADTGSGSAVDTSGARERIASGDGSLRGSSGDSSGVGAVGASPGTGVARAGGIADGGGLVLGLGHNRHAGGGRRSDGGEIIGRSLGGGGSSAGRRGNLKTTSDAVSSGAGGEIHVVGAAPGLGLGVVGAVVTLVTRV